MEMEVGRGVTLDHWPHPLTSEGRVTHVARAPPGTTLAALVATLPDVEPGAEPEAALDGEWIPAAAWAETPLRDGAIVTVRTAARGDRFMRTLLTIGVIAAAVYAPYALTAAGFGGLTTTVAGATVVTAAGSLVSAGVMVVGGLIVNALVPPQPPASGPGGADALPAYAVTGGANRARRYEPLLLVLGRHLVYPDLAVTPYTEYRDDDQYWHAAYDFGLGDPLLSNLQIGDTPIDEFDDVTYWNNITGSGNFSPDVDTIPGAALEWDADSAPPAGVWQTRRTSPRTQGIGLDFIGRLFALSDRGEVLRRTLSIEIQVRQVGATEWGYVYTFILTNDRQEPLRTSWKGVGWDGQYDVRVRRMAAPRNSTADREWDDVAWTALRSYQKNIGDYTDRHGIAIIIRASGQISGRLDAVNAVVSQQVPVWEAGAWTTPRATSNPAWIYRWFARGVWIGAGSERRLVAGAGLAADRIDDDAIKRWGAWCDTEGLTCDMLLDRPESQYRVLEAIARCGRATPTWGTGRLGVVWDAAGRAPTALVTPASILAGSYRTAWSGERIADEIVGRFADAADGWTVREVRRRAPGVTVVGASAAIDLRGITSRERALDAVTLQAARQAYHRRRHEWEMSADALPAERGDVVWVTHSLIDGGTAGRLDAVGEAGAVTLHRPVRLSSPDDRILVSLPDGSTHLAALAAAGAAEAGEPVTEVVLTPPLPDLGDADPLDCHWRFYGAAGEPASVRIVSVTPSGSGVVRYGAIDEVPQYYAALELPADAPLPRLPRRTPRVVAAKVSERLIRVGSGVLVELLLTLTVAGDWRGAAVHVESTRSPARRLVDRLIDGDVDGRWIESPTVGLIRIIVTPGSAAVPSGPAFALDYLVAGFAAPPGAPTNFLIDVLPEGTRRFRWTPPPDADLAGCEIRQARDQAAAIPWDRMTPMHTGLLIASPWETFEPASGRWVFAIRARDTGGRLSLGDARIVASLPDQRSTDVAFWSEPSAVGWPGSYVGAARSTDGRDALEATPTYTWADIATWGAWISWAVGDGNDAARSMTYTTDVIDLGIALRFRASFEADSAGAVTFEVRTAATRSGVSRAAWRPGGSIQNGRYIQARWRLAGNGSVGLYLDHCIYRIFAPTVSEQIIDANTSGWSAAGDGRLVPTSLAVVTNIAVTLQRVGSGASWEIRSKNPPRIKIYNGSGTEINAIVDIILTGFRSQ